MKQKSTLHAPKGHFLFHKILNKENIANSHDRCELGRIMGKAYSDVVGEKAPFLVHKGKINLRYYPEEFRVIAENIIKQYRKNGNKVVK